MRVLTVDELAFVAGGAYNSNNNSLLDFINNFLDDPANQDWNQIVVNAPVSTDQALIDFTTAQDVVSLYIDTGNVADFAGIVATAGSDPVINNLIATDQLSIQTVSHYEHDFVEALARSYDNQGGVLHAWANAGLIPEAIR